MLNGFTLNGDSWALVEVPSGDPMLIDRTGRLTVATTDPMTRTVYLSRDLQGPFRTKVLLHELGHCVMVSYGLLDEIREFVKPNRRVEAEEWMCNLIADYGFEIFKTAYKLLGEKAWRVLPSELGRYIA